MTLPTSGLFRPILASSIGALLLSAVSGIAWAQTPPETIRINVEPPKPGIRSVSVNKKYKPIISRDDAGVIIDTLGSSTTPPACDAELEVTLENSRVLYRAANLCAGGALVVDVDQDGKPGAARVIQDTQARSRGLRAHPFRPAPRPRRNASRSRLNHPRTMIRCSTPEPTRRRLPHRIRTSRRIARPMAVCRRWSGWTRRSMRPALRPKWQDSRAKQM